MAPNSALAFFILGAILFVRTLEAEGLSFRGFANLGPLLVSLIGLITLIQFLSGVDLGIDQILHRTSERFGGVLLGRMSPITALNFIFASASLLLLQVSSDKTRRTGSPAAAFAVIVIAVGLVVVLGYLYGAPLLYGGTVIPMALTTAFAFIFLGVGLIGAAGPAFWPVRPMIGSSTRARLLRTFLPVTVVLVLAIGWLQTVTALRPTNPALMSALLATLSLVAVSVIISRIAGSIGGIIDRTESERRQAEEKIRHQAYYDPLTDLPNRTLLCDRLRQAILLARREGRGLTLLTLDVLRFREINNNLGHTYGDRLLQQLAQRLRRALRESDTVARMEGDDFAVLLPGSGTIEHAGLAAHKVLKAVEAPFSLDDIDIDVEVSMGVALFPHHAEDPELLIRRADVARSVAKETGAGYVVYVPEQDHENARRFTLMGELRHAIDRNQLFLVYQPKIDLAEGRITGVEALLRWKHPQLGMVSPAQFIPLAERSGLIKPVTSWVLNTALRQCRLWQQAGLDLSVAVNLSVRNLLDPQLVGQVTQTLHTYHLEPIRLELEITESAIMADPARAMETLTSLSDRGVQLSIDDFGAGYTSLGYLKKLPVDTIKIDKGFVIDMISDRDDSVIVRSTIDLAHNLGLKVVAEGVESEEVLNQLVALGCNTGQGYYISRPISSCELESWLNDVAPLKGWILGKIK
jgi:diguanylate cyclase (GGDEF)-like protein